MEDLSPAGTIWSCSITKNACKTFCNGTHKPSIDSFPVVVQSLNYIRFFATPWTAAGQASLSFTISQSLLTHVHWVGDAIQPSYPLLLPSPAFNLFQLLGLFQWVGLSHQVAKVLRSVVWNKLVLEFKCFVPFSSKFQPSWKCWCQLFLCSFIYVLVWVLFWISAVSWDILSFFSVPKSPSDISSCVSITTYYVWFSVSPLAIHSLQL